MPASANNGTHAQHDKTQPILDPTPLTFCHAVLQWLPKETEDDVSIRVRLSKAAVVLQCWARTIVSRREVAEAAEEARVKANFAFVVTRMIQMCFRRHRAREELRVRKMLYRNACIVQKFARRKVRMASPSQCVLVHAIVLVTV